MCGNRRHCGTGGNLDNTANALASTANFLKGHGWQRQANPRFVVTSLTRDECKAKYL
jgi:membrane-bound lytic murein transglycosylase B